MWGGPSQLDTWDLKPDAPEEVRGDFSPISTSVPGIQICEHFPLLAQRVHQLSIIRSMTHDDPAHLSSAHHVLTGAFAPKRKSDADPPSARDTPPIGSVLMKMRDSSSPLPGYVSLPWIVSHPAAPGGKAPGQHGGWLGRQFDPFLVGDPNDPEFRIAGLTAPGEASRERLLSRHELLRTLDASGPAGLSAWEGLTDRAVRLVVDRATQQAFDLNLEPAGVRDRYGRNTHGQSVLLARRLIEAGVSTVTVNWPNDNQSFWDTHANNFPSLKNRLMPPADQAFSALLDDLSERGLLDETLVVWGGEFGRNPRINKQLSGREHWPRCYSAVLAGGGVRGGMVYGSSDRQGAAPAENPVSPSDLAATIYHALGISPETTLVDAQGVPKHLVTGRSILPLFTG
jgi:hypothetical protein